MNKKYLIIGIVAVLLITGIIIACVSCGNGSFGGNNPNHNHGEEIEGGEIPNSLLKDDPAVLVPDAIKLTKDKLGEHYLPNVAMTEDEILTLFGLTKKDCTFVMGEKCDEEDRYDMMVALRAAKGKEEKIRNAVHNYVCSQIDNEKLPEKVRQAYDGCMTLYNPDGYVFLLATFGDLNELDVNMISETVEQRGLEAFNIVASEISKYYTTE